MAFTLKSPSVGEGEKIPVDHTCDGANQSPQLKWADPQPNTASFVLILDDPDAPGGTFTHWVLFNIPGTQRELPAGFSNGRGLGTAGLNDFSRTVYGGPCPPRGNAHRYFFTLFALDTAALQLPDGASRHDIETAMRGHVIGQAQLMGRYQRK